MGLWVADDFVKAGADALIGLEIIPARRRKEMPHKAILLRPRVRLITNTEDF